MSAVSVDWLGDEDHIVNNTTKHFKDPSDSSQQIGEPRVLCRGVKALSGIFRTIYLKSLPDDPQFFKVCCIITFLGFKNLEYCPCEFSA